MHFVVTFSYSYVFLNEVTRIQPICERRYRKVLRMLIKTIRLKLVAGFAVDKINVATGYCISLSMDLGSRLGPAVPRKNDVKHCRDLV